MELTSDDIVGILELFERSEVDYLSLEIGSAKLVVNKNGAVPMGGDLEVPSAGSRAVADRVPDQPQPVHLSTAMDGDFEQGLPTTAIINLASEASHDDLLVTVTAPVFRALDME